MNRSVIKETIERLYMLKKDCPCRLSKPKLSIPSPKVFYLHSGTRSSSVDEIKREFEKKERTFFGEEGYELLPKNVFWEENMRKIDAFYQQVVEDEKKNRAFNAFISRF